LIIITALLKGFVLKERLAKHMWLGVIINSLAMGLVSVSALLGGSAEGQKDAKLGLGFIFLSCLVQGTQYIFEEKVMSVGGAHPLALVGLEGLWGVVLMCVVVFPLAYVVPGAPYARK
jgi:drug/metabolite transporter (DMT)-like permease